MTSFDDLKHLGGANSPRQRLYVGGHLVHDSGEPEVLQKSVVGDPDEMVIIPQRPLRAYTTVSCIGCSERAHMMSGNFFVGKRKEYHELAYLKGKVICCCPHCSVMYSPLS
jgi:hypothetical protein